MLQNLTEIGVRFVANLASGVQTIAPADFTRKLKARYVYDPDAQNLGAKDPSAFDWAALGFAVSRYFRPAPVTHHMLGPLDAVPRQKKAAQRQKRKAQVGEAVRPEEQEDTGHEEKQETDLNMEEMWKVLAAEDGRAYLLELVLNHRSFSQTVENLFTLSFLVKDARVELLDGERGVVVQVKHREHRSKDDPKAPAQAAERVQFIISLDMSQWEEWKKVTQAGDCLMKHRKEWDEGVPQQQLQQQNDSQQDDELQEPGPSRKKKRR